VAGAELGDRPAVLGLGGELAYPGGGGRGRDGVVFAAGFGGAAVTSGSG
jgi:hypothetical protein